jgi:preprotein translocase subunit YajC
LEFLIFLALGFGLMWLLIVLPQRRRTSAHDTMIKELKPGDYIVTAGGMYGTVTDLGEEDLGLEIAPDVEVRVAKRAVGAVIPEDEIEDVDEGPDGAEEPAEERTDPDASITAPEPPTADDRR